mmetsp:Transcript_39478/g.118507  ORF Transcript_39478/g.118507 Transcript_39478/m.118507 type:complete len:140 (-) Transcript_39478:186-605(-)
MLPGYGGVWYNKNGISNILYMSSVTKKFPVVCSRIGGNKFIVQNPTEHLIFNRSTSGLYFHNTGDRDVVLVSTVAGNRKDYTNQDYAASKKTRGSLALVGNPRPADYMNMVCSGLVRNFPVTPDAVTAAIKVLVPNFLP